MKTRPNPTFKIVSRSNFEYIISQQLLSNNPFFYPRAMLGLQRHISSYLRVFPRSSCEAPVLCCVVWESWDRVFCEGLTLSGMSHYLKFKLPLQASWTIRISIQASCNIFT